MQVYMSITGAALIRDESTETEEWTPVGESGKFENMLTTLEYYAKTAKECNFKIIIETY